MMNIDTLEAVKYVCDDCWKLQQCIHPGKCTIFVKGKPLGDPKCCPFFGYAKWRKVE